MYLSVKQGGFNPVHDYTHTYTQTHRHRYNQLLQVNLRKGRFKINVKIAMRKLSSVTFSISCHNAYTVPRIKGCTHINTHCIRIQLQTWHIINLWLSSIASFSLQKDEESLIFRHCCPRISHTLFLSHKHWQAIHPVALQAREETLGTEILLLGKHWKIYRAS